MAAKYLKLSVYLKNQLHNIEILHAVQYYRPAHIG